VTVDAPHQLEKAAEGDGVARKLDVTARTFGYLNRGEVFAGVVRFSDGHPVGKLPAALTCDVAVGQPDPDHRPFYPGPGFRKLYHHKVGATTLTPPHPGIRQTSRVRPLSPGVKFDFRVDFANVRDEELKLLLYCLALEEEVSVTLSTEAVGGPDPVTLRAPMRHKLGHCKPHGGGSVALTVTKWQLWAGPASRYRGQGDKGQVFEGEALTQALREQTADYRKRQDPTMQHLRAMWIYAANDPRAADLNYPTYGWFQEDSEDPRQTPLKPTL
jgi:hypothetical protein